MTGRRTKTTSPFHAGERAIQERLGVREHVDVLGRQMVRPDLTDQHRAFYESLPFIVIGALDRAGRPWCGILSGNVGFISTPDSGRLRIGKLPSSSDPLGRCLRLGSEIGILGIQLDARRRNRLSGRIERIDADEFTIAVDQAYGNCPQYIQARSVTPIARIGVSANFTSSSFARLDASMRTLLETADTFFIASHGTADAGDNPLSGGVDASHRGGRPGFVRVEDDGRSLLVPDFVGNFHFNTLGNIMRDPRVGLVFPNFAEHSLLFLTGTAEIIWDGPQLRAFRGAERLLRVRIEEGSCLTGGLPLDFASPEFSPNNLMTGTWGETESVCEAERGRDDWRPYRISRIVDESSAVKSFILATVDGSPRPLHLAGQYLPVRLPTAGGGFSAARTYTVSSAPADPFLRITVKRDDGSEGVSALLHESTEGDTIEALGPRGSFTFDAGETRPAVLISAGIGITPMVAMLRHAVHEGRRTRHFRPIWFVHGSRTSADRPFRRELRDLSGEMPPETIALHFAVTQTTTGDVAGRSYQSVGRIGPSLFEGLLPFGTYDFYICGSRGFVQSVYDTLSGLDVPDDRIHDEAFDPDATVRRNSRDGNSAPSAAVPVSKSEVEVFFEKSGESRVWSPGSQSLLELAESAGLTLAYACRSGLCGACSTRLVEGEVAYRGGTPRMPVEQGKALICCAFPADGSKMVVLDV